MPEEQRAGMRQLRRLYLGRLGDVLRQRQAIAGAMQPAGSAFDGGRESIKEYLKVRYLQHQSVVHSSSVVTFCGAARCSPLLRL